MLNEDTKVGFSFLFLAFFVWLVVGILIDAFYPGYVWVSVIPSGFVAVIGVMALLDGLNAPRAYKLTFGIEPDPDGSLIPEVLAKTADDVLDAYDVVHRTLGSLAVTLDKLCHIETKLLETRVTNFEMKAHLGRIKHVQRNLWAAKKAFWRAHRLAKIFGREGTGKSYKDYLPRSGPAMG